MLFYAFKMAVARMSNMVTGNPRTREKNPWKQVQGMGGLRFWDFQVYKTGTRSFSSHMVFLGKTQRPENATLTTKKDSDDFCIPPLKTPQLVLP